MSEKKRALGTGAKCCGHCELCAPQPKPEVVTVKAEKASV